MRVLAIGAHPDDETLGAGGTLALHAEQGDEVWVCILTDGVTSRHGHVELQERCAQRAADTLGVKRVVFCGFGDQNLDALPLLEVIRPIERCIGELEPQVVYTHFGGDVNQDHRTVFDATLVAARPGLCSVQRLLCWETASSTEWAAPFPGSVFAPNVFVDIETTLPKKIEAMRCYADTFFSEVRPFPHPRSYEALEVYAKRHGIVAGMRAAEPFMLVRELVHHNGEGSR
jgi:LmbE family N-acetylglucosaminyl deacetylase